MANKDTKSSGTSKANPALAWHFARIKGDLSFAAIRKKMADEGLAIGSSTLQRMALGEPGARLESLNKLAMFAKKAPETVEVKPVETPAMPLTTSPAPSEVAQSAESAKQ